MTRNEISVVVDVKGKIDNFRAAAEQMQGYLNKLELPKMAENKSTSIFSQLSREIEKIQNLTAKGKIDPIDDKNIKTAYHNIENLIGQLEDLSNSPAVRGAWSKDLIQGWNKANSVVKDYIASMKELESRQAKLQSARIGVQGRLDTASVKKQNLLGTASVRQTKYEKQITEQSEAQGRIAAQAYQKAYETYLSQHPTSKFHKLGQDAWKNSLNKNQIAEISKMMTDKNVINEADLAKALKLDETRAKLDSIKQIIDDITNNKSIDIVAAAEHGMTGEAKAYNLDLPNVQKIQQEINTIDESLNKITQEAAPKFNELRQQLLQIQGIDWSKILPQGKDLNNASIEEIVQSLTKFASAQNEAVDNSAELKKSFGDVARGARELSTPLEKAGEDLVTLKERSQNAQQTLSRLQYYFSSISVFMLFRRAIRSARDAVKELDDAMTETAVVTNYTISDLWKKLPEYTKRANELGVSTLAAYQSATLYYQQGLNDTQVSEMSVETLKMARIAGIEAADATNLMTGAIRAFNMEINKMSAQRVNDVYNKLAAMTAANTKGIATAMTKVASIAHSVGAEFENVAAFLAQMIETTQEAPETLGTALKTVFARFAEVKKLYSEGQITGSDEEGEEINVNKIQEALRTVGISMTDFLVGKEGLDQVIMRLAQKWDSLDTVTQRYIATMAAGSRQQSRFISLLQDFGRTQELINAANNSEGAAQKQFEKTLDSLQSKTEQLKNAWDEFLLDLANSDVIKGVVDLLNNLVTALNKITGAFGSSGSGIAKLLLGLGVLKGGRALLGGAKYMMDPAIMDKYGNSRLKAFRAGAGAQMGLGDEYVKNPNKSLIGSAYQQKIKGPWQSLKPGHGIIATTRNNKALKEQLKADQEYFAERKKNWEKESAKLDEVKANAEKGKYQDKSGKWRYDGSDNTHKRGTFVASPDSEVGTQQAKVVAAEGEMADAQNQLKDSSEAAAQGLQQSAQQMQAIGQIAGIAAGGCFLLANALEKSGNKKAAKAFKILGITLSVLSGVFMILGTVAQITAAQIETSAMEASTAIMNIPILGWIAAIIAALIALIAIVVSFTETTEQRLKRLHEETEKAREAAEEASKAYDDLLAAHKDYDTRLEEIQKLTKGTEEYKQAVKELNEEILGLSQNYPDLKYIYDPETGLLKVEEESWNRAQNIAAERKRFTAASYNLSSAREEKATNKETIKEIRQSFGSNAALGGGAYDNVSYVERLTDAQVIALKKLGFDRDKLEHLLYYEIRSGDLNRTLHENQYSWGWDDSTNLQDYQELYWKKLLEIINNIDKTIENPQEEIDSKIQNTLYSLSDQEKASSYTLSRFYTEESFNKSEFKPNQRGQTEQWYQEDWSREVDGKTIWDHIIDTALEKGLIDDLDAAYFKKSSKTSNDVNRKLLAKILNKTEEEIEDYEIEDVSNYLGNFYVSGQMEKIFKADQKDFESLPPETQKALKTLAEKPNDLTQRQIDLLNKEWDNLFTGPNAIFENAEVGNLKKIISDIEWEGPKELINSDKYVDYYSRSSEAMWKKLTTYGEDFGKAYEDVFKQIIDSNLSNEDKEEALAILNAADVTNVKSLWNTFKLLDSAGIKINADTREAISNFIINLEEAGIAIQKFTEETAKEEAKSYRSIINKFLDKPDQRDITAEEYKIIEEALTQTGNTEILKTQFQEQVDGSYKYVGNDLSTIISILNTIVNKIPNYEQNRLNARAEVAKLGSTKGATTGDWIGRYGAPRIIQSEEETENWNKHTKVLYYNAVMQNIPDEDILAAGLVKELNEDSFDEQVWLDFLNLILNPEEAQKAANDYSRYLDLFGQQDVEKLYGISKNEEEYTNEERELASNIIKNDLYESNEIAQELDAAWGDSVENLRKTDALVESIAVDVAKLNKNISDCEESFKDNYDILKKNDRKTKEWRESAVALQKAIKKAFGVDLTADQIIEGGDFFESFFKGEEGSAKNLGNWLVEQVGIPDSLPPDKVSQLNTIIDNAIANVNPEGVNIPFEVDQASLNAIGADTKAAMDAYAKMFGIELKWQETTPLGPGEEPSWKLTYATAGGGGFGSKKSGGGGGGKTSPWENPYDKYHNLLQEIDELLRTRNDLERQYEKILANRHSTIQDILKNSRENLANLEREIVAQKMLQKGRQEQFRNLAKDDYYFDEKGKRRSFAQQAAEFGINLSDYARYNEETQEMEINWDAFEEVERRSETDAKWAEVGKFLEKYYDKLKELTDSYEDTQDTIEEMEDEIQEILERSKEDYLDFEQELYDALVDHIQQYIDAEQKLSDTIKDAETKVLDHLRESIDLERQIRDNTKTEEDIADKENRLAYLQRDTTGANAVEIMQLQKEIQEARENYQDTLVDQELERLNRISEEAAQQREHQIELMQEQLDWAQKAGYFWNEVESILQTALKSGDTSLIEQLLKGVGDFNEKSMFGDRAWKDELIERFLKASEGRANWELDNAKENHTSWASRIAATGKEGTVGIWWDAEKKQWVDAKGNTYTGVGYDVQTGKWKYENRFDRVKEETERPPSSGGSGTQPQSGQNEKPKQKTYSSTQKYNGYEGTATSKTSQKDADNLAMKNAINTAISSWQSRAAKILEGINELEITMRAAYSVSRPSIQAQIDELKDIHSNLMAKIRLANIDLRQYKTGGLTTQTGPAWLDGTPSKPEYVLNAAQTQAFLQLADVLPSMISGGSSLTNAPTAVNIDIDINVDSIANDYDVDRLCDRVKEDLYSDLMYRNINVVNLRR